MDADLTQSNLLFKQDGDSDFEPMEVSSSSPESPITIESSDSELDRPPSVDEPEEDEIEKVEILVLFATPAVHAAVMAMMGDLLQRVPLLQEMSLSWRNDLVTDIKDLIMDEIYEMLINKKQK